ncbi:aldo/keto reductase [Anditalea andensis]|uniref:L-fucose dehydrogenase n=1 Tax=Anditalea andensis TaxID=1048983 RepID=A0A074L3H4_9BACT|nr:aldo/keto reductase [Anditalea andensis]KEO75719.1 L-fucose dehydrogenase [Anditalea andensis]
MTSRRNFITTGLKITAGASLAPLLPAFGSQHQADLPILERLTKRGTVNRDIILPANHGLGGVAIGNAFRPTTDEEARGAMEAAWEAGVRFYDTSPYYGLGLSERRFGQFLHNKKREDYILATKIGRIMKPTSEKQDTMWKEPAPFKYDYDYSASGTRRSIEDSLQRLGIESIDIVFIHDLSPENEEMDWEENFKKAEKGAMPELVKMREEGLIKGWGMGVNRIEPILKAIEASDPDICLTATQYSLIEHEDALNRLFPVCEKNNVKLVSGAPLNSGFLAGIDRYNYSEDIPEKFLQKRKQLKQIADDHNIDLRTAALQFCAAPEIMAAVIPGTRYASQAKENVVSMTADIPAAFWQELKQKGLIAKNAPLPKNV